MSGTNKDAVKLLAELIADLRKRIDTEHSCRASLQTRIKLIESSKSQDFPSSDGRAITNTEIDSIVSTVFGSGSDADAQQKS